ncbi:ATP-binding protein [Amycolatopsis aidingensis]|uniref:ATP-binding protein n=1 Tax=Amycolatopsis aidingensis TaxID=2842453 RepID=UPI001C0C6D72|nr:LuxR C-terminal-related transcriptional regulator [Amycolatopsis aidingensis]
MWTCAHLADEGHCRARARTELTSYVGRKEEDAEVRRLLGIARLVTLTGPGGVGKTRLAEHSAATVSRAFADGVLGVALAEVRDASLLTGLIVHRLGLHDRSHQPALDTVADYLREKQLLLVLDNCEHLAEGCAELVSTLLARCPRLVVLATSRRSLGVAGEHVHTVAPLSVPPEHVTSAHALAARDAVQLFVERARSVVPSFRLTEDNGPDVARVCRQVDGLPLGIELAAARIRALSPRQIAQRLDDRLALLTTGARTVPERQRTLRATVDWSFALCTETERAVWSRCSVFAGSFDLAAAEYVCAGSGVHDDEVLAAVDSLIDMSVLLREDGVTTVRYRMLETLRDYGHQRLVAQNAGTEVARRHRDYYFQLTEDADAGWFGPRQRDWMDRLRAEHANLRVALAWSLTEPGEATVALRMATRVSEYLVMSGAPREAREWIDRALSAVPEDEPGRALALSTSALCALFHSDLPLARVRLDEAGELDAAEAHAHLSYVRSFAAMLSTEPAVELAAEAVRAFAERGETRAQMHPLFILGISVAYRGDLDLARALLRQMLSLCEDAGDSHYRSMALFGIGVVEVWFGDADVAEEAMCEALRIDLRTGDRLSAAYRVDGLAWVAARQGRYARAARLFGAAATMWERCGAAPDVAVSIPHRGFRDATRDALGIDRFECVFAEGRSLTPADVAPGVSENDPSGVSGVHHSSSPLTHREAEVADLVAAGMTNREIARRLVIAQRTADTHVQHILTKLDLSNRTQLTAWVVERRAVHDGN